MSEWIKYDGTNRPNGETLVRIEHDPDLDCDGEAWQSRNFTAASRWGGWGIENGDIKPLIARFMIKDSTQ